MRRVAVVAGLLFLSGVCALVYQIGWLRELRLVFGASTAATAVVLAVFMGGLGLGGLLFGRRADRSANPLRMYAHLELSVAVLALASPYLIALARWLYLASGGASTLGWAGATGLRLVLAAVVLGVPTVLMGGTLPAAVRSVESAEDRERRRLAVLYGVNTLGAVTGAALASFALLELVGTRSTIWLSGGANLVVGVVALMIARYDDAAGAVAALEEIEVSEPSAAPQAPAGFVYVAACVVGAAFLAMELVWYRALAPILGGSTYTFGLILAVALAGIGGGGWLYSLRRERPDVMLFAVTCGLEAALIGIPFALGDRLAVFAALLEPVGNVGFAGQVVGWLIVTAVVVLPAAAVSGYQFPVLVGCLGAGRREVGQHTGRTYASNTFGAILGSLAGGFLLIPVLGVVRSWQLVVVGLALLAVVAVVLALVRSQRRVVPLAVVVASVALAVVQLQSTGPTAVWRHSPIGAGRVELADAGINEIQDWMRFRRRSIVWDADGVETTVGLAASSGLAFVVNGKVDGNTVIDSGTQIMSPLIGAALHPRPRSTMVVGLGTGCSAGWLAEVESVESVVVAELEGDILEVARRCAPVNHDVVQHPKVDIEVGDARELLLTSRQRYDVIVSEPSNPYRAGVASLYTREFYEAVRQRLTDGGVFCQFTQAYEVDTRTIRTILATLKDVFAVVQIWQTLPGDMLFVAANEPIEMDASALRQRLAREPFRSGMAVAWGATDLEGFLARFVATDDVCRHVAAPAVRSGWINTDDRMLVEFSFARTVGRQKGFSLSELRVLAQTMGGSRPPVVGPVDWGRVADSVLEIYAVADDPIPAVLATTTDQSQWAQILNASHLGNLSGVLSGSPGELPSARTPVQLAAVGEAAAEAGLEACLALASELRPWWPSVADGIEARFFLSTGQLEPAVAAYREMIEALRDQPWPGNPSCVRRAVRLGVDLVRADPRHGPEVLALLAEPFSVRLLDEWRVRMAFEASLFLRDSQATAEVLHRWEPHVPWEEEVLAVRAAVYEATEDPLAEQAGADLARFRDNAPERIR